MQGEPTEDKFGNGPIDDRGCTDIICCLFFVAFIVGMIIVTAQGFDKGDPVRLLAPYASDSKRW